jgi:alpha-1,2-mannosyltransferase
MSMSAIAPRISSRGRFVFLGLLVVLFALLGLRYSIKVLQDRSAFRRWQPQIQQLSEGVDLSARFNYPNPPIMAVLLEPFARMPPLAGAITWFSLKLAMAVVSLYWVFRLVEAGGIRFPVWAMTLAVVCSLKPILDDLNHGNVNLLILFLIVAALTAYRRRHDLLAGVILALAIACKLTPALFLPYLVWKRAWRTLAGCVIGLVLFFYPGVVPGLRLGMEENQKQLTSWYHVMVLPYVRDGKVTSEHVNQSLPGLIYRLATHSPSFVTFVNDVETPARYDNLLSLSPDVARWTVKGCICVFGLLVLWCCRTPPAQREGVSVAAEFSIVVLGMLLFSERTWKHHCVTLMLPYAVLCYHVAVARTSPLLRRGLIAVLILALLLTTLPGLGTGSDRNLAAISPGFAKMSLVYGAYSVACLLLLAGLVGLLRWSANKEATTVVPRI